MTQGKADDTNKVFFNLPVIFDLDDDEQPQTEDEELDQLLTEFLTFTLGNKVIEASPEYARERAKAAIQSLLERRRIDTLKEAKRIVLHRTGIPKDAKNPTRDQTVITGEICANAIQYYIDIAEAAELSQRGKLEKE